MKHQSARHDGALRQISKTVRDELMADSGVLFKGPEGRPGTILGGGGT
jgi:hypothetical protein